MATIHEPHSGSDAPPVRTMTTAEDDARTIMVNRVSWGAILAGVVVGLTIQVVLTVLGVGIGVATLDPGTSDNPAASTFSIAAGIWYVVSALIAAYTGGYVASRMSGHTAPTTGALHGLTAWAFATLVVVYMLSTATGALVGGAFSGIASAVGGVSQTVAQAAGPALANMDPLTALSDEVRATGNDPEALNAQAVNAMRAYVTGDEAGKAEARQRAAEALARARNIPVEEADQQIARMEAEYRQTVDTMQQRATQAADTAASAVSTGAIMAFFALLLGAIAGWLGGRSGVVHPIFADRLIPSRRVM